MAPPLPPVFSMDILYSFVIVICSLMIYFATKEMYELSSYKGVRYFRLAFLFFAIAYFFRSFVNLFVMFFNQPFVFELSPRFLPLLSLSFFMYFSSMGIFYLVYSLMWKVWKNDKLVVPILHLISLVLAIITLFTRDMFVMLLVNILLLVSVVTLFFIAHKSSKNRKSGLFVVYLLLLTFWVLNMIDMLLPRFMEMFQLLIYLVSVFLFLLMLYKVLKKVGSS